MATDKWSAFTSRGNVLSTALNSLADATISAAGSEIDNGTNLDKYGVFVLTLASLTPVTPAYVTIYLNKAVDGTNYETAPVTGGTDQDQYAVTIPVTAGAAAKTVASRMIRLPPCKFKPYLDNQLNVAMAASGNILALYTANSVIA